MVWIIIMKLCQINNNNFFISVGIIDNDKFIYNIKNKYFIKVYLGNFHIIISFKKLKNSVKIF